MLNPPSTSLVLEQWQTEQDKLNSRRLELVNSLGYVKTIKWIKLMLKFSVSIHFSIYLIYIYRISFYRNSHFQLIQ